MRFDSTAGCDKTARPVVWELDAMQRGRARTRLRAASRAYMYRQNVSYDTPASTWANRSSKASNRPQFAGDHRAAWIGSTRLPRPSQSSETGNSQKRASISQNMVSKNACVQGRPSMFRALHSVAEAIRFSPLEGPNRRFAYAAPHAATLRGRQSKTAGGSFCFRASRLTHAQSYENYQLRCIAILQPLWDH